MGLPDNQRKKKRQPLMFMKQSNDDLALEANLIGQAYTKPIIMSNENEDEEWVLKDAEQKTNKSSNAWD